MVGMVLLFFLYEVSSVRNKKKGKVKYFIVISI